tara:strand:- start:12887 stop:13081 length:195 start_codon:yes stop_codon:yes gene_type:complete
LKISKSHYKKIKNQKWHILTPVRKLGHKDVAYYTEEEMLKETKYTYESLSPDEKKIYDESRSNK